MSLLMVRKYAPAHAADAHIDDIAYKYKVGDKIKTPDGVGTVQKKTHTNSGKPAYEVKLDKGGIVVYVEQSVSAADADKSEELEREIKGDVVAVVSGNAARVSKDVSFATAKEGVESFARKNGVSVVASQEYGEAYKFKFSAAIDSDDVAQDRGDYTTNATALLKMAYENLNKAEGVVTRAGTNISDAKSKVKDEQTKSFLKRIEHEWWACKEEIYEVIKELRTIAVPSSYGVPHKEKIPPEDRNILAAFFE